MSEVEIPGLAASVIQLANTGLKLSVDLCTFTRKVKSADPSIDGLSHDIAATSAVLQQLGQILSDQKSAEVCSPQAVARAQGLFDDCARVFEEVEITIGATVPQGQHAQSSARAVNLKRKLNLKYLKSQVVELKADLERLKSGLLVIVNVLVLAEHVRSQVAGPILKDQQTLLKLLVEENTVHEKRYHEIAELAKDREDLDSKHGEDDEPVSSPFHVPATGPKHGSGTNQSKEPAIVLGTEKDKLPEGLKRSYRQLVDSGRLVEHLVRAIKSTDYQIDHFFRMTLHNSVLNSHWDSWSTMRSVHGTQVFLDMYNDFEEVARLWNDQKALDDHDEKQFKENAKRKEFNRGLWEEYANSRPPPKGPIGSKNSLIVDEGEPPLDIDRPTYIRIHRKHILPETLNRYHLNWEIDQTNHNFVIIKEYIDIGLQRELFEHTKMLLNNRVKPIAETDARGSKSDSMPSNSGASGTTLETIPEENVLAPTQKQDMFAQQMRSRDPISNHPEPNHSAINDSTPSRSSTFTFADASEVGPDNTGPQSTDPTNPDPQGLRDAHPDPLSARSPLTPSWASDNGDDVEPTVTLETTDPTTKVPTESQSSTIPPAKTPAVDVGELLLRFSSLSGDEVSKIS